MQSSIFKDLPNGNSWRNQREAADFRGLTQMNLVKTLSCGLCGGQRYGKLPYRCDRWKSVAGSCLQRPWARYVSLATVY